MDELLNFGLSENTIKAMIEENDKIVSLTDEEIIDKENLLRGINCSEEQIINIISSNASFLSCDNNDVINLFIALTNYGFTTLNILFDANPYILNLRDYELKNYINSRLNNNESLEMIVDDLESNPILFNEI